MVDRVYKRDIPAKRKALERLRVEFSHLDTRTDWTRLRVDPVLAHARTLERLLRSPRFSGEASRLRQGVVLFHSDLVYLRENVRGLERILKAERKKSTAKRGKIPR